MPKTKNKYYSLDRILETESTYNVIIGERSNGKTYATLKYALEQFFNHGSQLAYLRRWQEDIRGRRASEVFTGLVQNNEVYKLSGGEYEGIYYYAGKWYVCNFDSQGKAIYNDSDVFAYAFAISDMEHNKSLSYPRVRTIVFDEFLTKGMELTDEFILFMNTISTIIRDRTDVKIFMLGNTVNKYSTYFEEMGLYRIKEQEQGSIDVYTYGEESTLKVAVEYAESKESKKANNFYFAFNNPKLHMITSGAWELDLYPHLPEKYKQSEVILNYFIKFDGELYQGEVIDKQDYMFTFIHRKTTPIQDDDEDLIYSLEYNPKLNYSRSIYKPTTKMGDSIKWFFDNDKVFFQNNNIGNAISNYLHQAKQQT